MPKSTGPLSEQLGLSSNQSPSNQPTSTGNNSTSASTDTHNVPDTITAANNIGAQKSTNAIPQGNPSILSSAGAIGKQFNSDGSLGQIPQAIGGPFSKDGMIGKQFDASKNGIAGHVERAVDGPSNPAGSSQ